MAATPRPSAAGRRGRERPGQHRPAVPGAEPGRVRAEAAARPRPARTGGDDGRRPRDDGDARLPRGGDRHLGWRAGPLQASIAGPHRALVGLLQGEGIRSWSTSEVGCACAPACASPFSASGPRPDEAAAGRARPAKSPELRARSRGRRGHGGGGVSSTASMTEVGDVGR